MREFADELLAIGIQRIYPDAIAHALYYSLKYGLQFNMSEDKLEKEITKKIIEIDDCVSMVLLREYAKRHGIKSIQNVIRERSKKLRGADPREKDRLWLLIYQVWIEKTLRSEDQPFLADLKKSRFSFVRFP